MEHTRRRFLGSAAAIAAALGIDGFDSSLTAAPPKDLPSGPWRRGFGRGARQEPQVIYTNARVYTMDERVHRAEAFAIDDDRFLAVGGQILGPVLDPDPVMRGAPACRRAQSRSGRVFGGRSACSRSCRRIRTCLLAVRAPPRRPARPR